MEYSQVHSVPQDMRPASSTAYDVDYRKNSLHLAVKTVRLDYRETRSIKDRTRGGSSSPRHHSRKVEIETEVKVRISATLEPLKPAQSITRQDVVAALTTPRLPMNLEA